MSKLLTKHLVMIILLFWAIASDAQDVGRVDLKVEGFTQKKFKNAEKKIYIQHFFVKYQVMMSASEIARGGREAGGGVRSDAKASMSLGIKGIDSDNLQKMTDQFYKDFVSQLKAEGFSILTAEEVQKNENFADKQLVKGGNPSADEIPGYLFTTPTNYSFLVGGAGAFNLAGMPQSNKLGGAIVARVNITVPFVENAESQGSKALSKTFGGVAKIVLKPNLRISPHESVPVAGDFKKPKNTYTEVTFAYKKSLKWQALYLGKLKKAIEIDGVFEEKKYKAVESGSQDLWGTQVGMFQVFSADNTELSRMQSVPCETEEYVNGVSNAISDYLNKSVAGFIAFLK